MIIYHSFTKVRVIFRDSGKHGNETI